VGLPKPFQQNALHLFQDCRLRRLPKMAGVPKPFQQNAAHLFQDCRLRRLPKMAGVPKPSQQNAAHFVGFFNAQAFTSELATLSH
jgi:sulfur relay (sulfurtransferase) DsrC/TusE family protein